MNIINNIITNLELQVIGINTVCHDLIVSIGQHNNKMIKHLTWLLISNPLIIFIVLVALTFIIAYFDKILRREKRVKSRA